MTIFSSRDQAGRPVDGDWHAFRERARREAFSAEEFGSLDRERYDLDDDAERSAGITGEDNPDTYRGEGAALDPEGRDIREDPIR